MNLYLLLAVHENIVHTCHHYNCRHYRYALHSCCGRTSIIVHSLVSPVQIKANSSVNSRFQWSGTAIAEAYDTLDFP